MALCRQQQGSTERDRWREDLSDEPHVGGEPTTGMVQCKKLEANTHERGNMNTDRLRLRSQWSRNSDRGFDHNNDSQRQGKVHGSGGGL